MTATLDPTPAVHTWSLFRIMNRYVAPGAAPSGLLREQAEPGPVGVLDLPGELARHGYRSAQLCHFYLPDTSPGFLAEVRDAFRDAEVDLECLLVDDGDLVDPEGGHRAVDWLSGWVEVAEGLGTPRVRVPAGNRPPTPALLEVSAERLQALAHRHPDVRVVTENWLALLPDAPTTARLLDLVGDEVGLLLDTGNLTGEDKYEGIRSLAGRAELSQVKARETADVSLDEEDLRACLRALADGGYTGRLSFVYAGTDPDEWGRLARIRAVAQEFTGGPRAATVDA